MREATAVVGALVGVVVIFTILAGGGFTMGTSASGPYFTFGYSGAKSRY